MANKKPDPAERPRIELESLAPDEPRPDLQIEVFDAKGECIHVANVKEDGTYSMPDAHRKKAARFVLGPTDADENAEDSRFAIRAEEFLELEKAGVVRIGRAIWKGWIPFIRCATGSVRRCWPGPWWFEELEHFATEVRGPQLDRLAGIRTAPVSETRVRVQPALGNPVLERISPVGSLDELLAWRFRCAPVCDARIEVYRRTCCCRPFIIDDPRLPELVDWLDDLIPVPVPPDPPFPDPVPEPIPEPGPIPQPGPDPVPFAGTLAADQGFVRNGALDEVRIHAARDAQALRSLSPAQVVEYVNARPYLICGRFECSSPVRVASGTVNPSGRFNICWLDYRRPLARNCRDQYTFVIRQRFGPFWLTIYDGRSVNKWHGLGDDPTLTTYHRLARTCRRNPANAFVYLNYIGTTGAWDLHTPNADSATGVHTPGFNSGLVSPNGATGPSGNRNWGGTLKLNLMIGEGMKAVGARYYRLSVTAASALGDPVGTRNPVDAPISWKKAVPDGSGGVNTVSVTLGPFSVGGQDELYSIPYDSDGDWDDGQFHASLDTADPRWDSPFLRHLVTVEIFDKDGKRLRPQGTSATGLGGSEGTAAFTYRRRYQDLGPTAEVPFGALTHMFWWDNRDVFGKILNLRRNGLTFDQECLFLSGSANSTFGIGYRAYHPNQRFQRFHNVWWKRGLGTTAGNIGYLEFHNPNNVGVLSPLGGASGTDRFWEMLRTDLVADRLKCAFTVFLTVWNKRTNGSNLSFHHANDSAAFVIEINS